MLNIKKIRNDFNQLKTKINKKNIVYFDNAATSLKPNILTRRDKKVFMKMITQIFIEHLIHYQITQQIYMRNQEKI